MNATKKSSKTPATSTPGPWYAVENRVYSDSVGGSAGMPLAVTSDAKLLYRDPAGRRAADAKLIAAAPTMADTLELIANDPGAAPHVREMARSALAGVR
jgi:hypothetical protein